MKNFKYVVSFVMVLALALVFIGCAKPPDAEKSAAKAAMDAAVAVAADKYAATDFNAAKTIWDTSEAQMTAKKYEEAKQGYVGAKVAFEKATAAAAVGKKAITDEMVAVVASLEEGWKNLEASAKSVEKKMKDQKDAWEADTKAFVDGLKATKDMVATDPAGAKAKAGVLKSTIDKWDAAFKELAAAPSKPEATKKGAKSAKKEKK
jgi:PBP1b-binding outer membrane lipoprotein LpoB